MYIWSTKTEKNKNGLCLYFNTTLFILLHFFWNEIYFKYTSESEKEIIDLGNIIQICFWVWT